MTEESIPTSDESGTASATTPGSGGDVQYIFMTAKAIRGREGATRTKHQNEGWEFVSQTQGTLRSELTFRKVKPKGLGAHLGQGYAAFRRLEPKTQKAVLGGVGGLVGLIVIGIVVAAVASGGDASEPPRSASATEAVSEVPEPTPESTAPVTPAVEPYTYDGPKYEVVVVDDNQGPAKLSQYWIHTGSQFDFSNDAYKDQVKLIFSDIAHDQGTDKFIAEVVTNKEIAEAESPSTYEDFIAEHGLDYAINTIPKLEKEGWVANYTGGFDGDTGKPSDDDSAFSILWRPYAAAEIEEWKPDY